MQQDEEELGEYGGPQRDEVATRDAQDEDAEEQEERRVEIRRLDELEHVSDALCSICST